MPRAPQTNGQKASERVAYELRKEIVTGAVEDGELLGIESEIVERFQVSRPTVREALRILEIEGLIRLARGNGGGIIVRRPDVELPTRYVGLLLQMENATIGDVYVARSLMDAPAVRLLATRRDPEVVRDLRERLDRAEALLEEPDRYVEAMIDFNVALVRHTGNKTLTLVVRILNGIVREAREWGVQQVIAEGETLPELRVRMLGLFRELVDLIEAGKADEAAAFWREFLTSHTRREPSGEQAATIVDLLGYR